MESASPQGFVVGLRSLRKSDPSGSSSATKVLVELAFDPRIASSSGTDTALACCSWHWARPLKLVVSHCGSDACEALLRSIRANPTRAPPRCIDRIKVRHKRHCLGLGRRGSLRAEQREMHRSVVRSPGLSTSACNLRPSLPGD